MHHFEPAPSASAKTVSPPSAWLAATELPRAIAEAGLFTAMLPQLLACAPRGDGHPVLVIPGFLAGDKSTAPLRRGLRHLGYEVRGWGLGRNVGPRSAGSDGGKLTQRIAELHEQTGRTVSLVGWSLGGVLARITAAKEPAGVRQVITLGSPFAGSPRATNAWRLYEKVSGAPLGSAGQDALMRTARRSLAVPSTAIFSRADGICAWEICRGASSALSENIEVHGSHCGLGANPSVFLAIADRLAQRETSWAPFEPQALTGWMFPSGSRRSAD
jgi:pimeloyl-ACP methyl ester carboxylesterase